MVQQSIYRLDNQLNHIYHQSAKLSAYNLYYVQHNFVVMHAVYDTTELSQLTTIMSCINVYDKLALKYTTTEL